jgi:hypothetical protein
MLDGIRAFLGLPLGIAGIWAWVMMSYSLIRWKSSAELEDRGRWKKRYYKCMMIFLAAWLLMFILFKFGGWSKKTAVGSAHPTKSAKITIHSARREAGVRWRVARRVEIVSTINPVRRIAERVRVS